MAISIERADAGDVDSLRELWLQLHHHHQRSAATTTTDNPPVLATTAAAGGRAVCVAARRRCLPATMVKVRRGRQANACGVRDGASR
jgi:hypothetical protein